MPGHDTRQIDGQCFRHSLIVSCQPVPDGPTDTPDFVVGFARAAVTGMVRKGLCSAPNRQTLPIPHDFPLVEMAGRLFPECRIVAAAVRGFADAAPPHLRPDMRPAALGGHAGATGIAALANGA